MFDPLNHCVSAAELLEMETPMPENLGADSAGSLEFDADVGHLEHRPVRLLDTKPQQSGDRWIFLVVGIGDARTVSH